MAIVLLLAFSGRSESQLVSIKIQLELESIAFTDPVFKDKKASELMDSSIVAELDRKVFFSQVQ